MSVRGFASLASSTTSSRQRSHISTVYRQSSTLFLTRRLPEALSTLKPLVEPQDGQDDGEPAPVAVASKSTRVKVWGLYLTILNAIVELSPEEGKEAFGSQDWRAICAKVRGGGVWEEVVKYGYHGVEGNVDSEVVINLATLLLAHARDQILNQKRLETYLATSIQPSLDLSSTLSDSRSLSSRSSSRIRSPMRGTSGADTPRDLNARVKILELYTLHVLLRNNEWDYAREFITVSAVLDEERREAFLQALQSLQDEQEDQERREREERRRQEEQLRRDVEESRRLRAENEEREKKRLEEERLRRSGSSEVDYGIDETPSASSSGPGRRQPPRSSHQGLPRPAQGRGLPQGRGSGKAMAGPLTITSRAFMMMDRLRHGVDELATFLNSNPMVAMRLMAFIMGLLLMLGNKAIRLRMRRLMASSWGKLKATVGMGAKVSYI